VNVLHQVFLEEDDGHGSIKKFAAKDITLAEIQDDHYNRRWDGIIELMVCKVSEKYKIGGQDRKSRPVAAARVDQLLSHHLPLGKGFYLPNCS
jgi:hypothetical protein